LAAPGETGGWAQGELLPVSVSAERKRPVADGGLIEIDLGNGVQVRVDSGVDEAALGRVLRALGDDRPGG
jgi:hypothetical protein